MRIRHLIAAEHVDERGFVILPEAARHGVIVGGRVAALAAPIEPETHLNLDFPDHRLEECLVVEQMTVDAAVLRTGERFVSARVRPTAYRRLGRVDIDARRAAWQERLRTEAPR